MFMRLGVLLLTVLTASAQMAPEAAYQALQEKRYDDAISRFLQAIEDAPQTAALRKDLAYTYLKTGERELARDQFGEAVRLDPADTQAALEYAFLCFETQKEAEARRIFDRLRQSADAATRSTAETAFQNIDRPLAAAIGRWSEALRRGDNSFSTHYELARLAERRDDLALAGEQYEKAWQIAPEHKSVLIELGRVWQAMGRAEDATAALLAASRGGEARAAESARELLPARYPYVYEFETALKLDPRNTGLRRELGFLLLRMNRGDEAEEQFRVVSREEPADLLSAAQLGFLLLARGADDEAKPLLDRVLQGGDADLANRARAVLRQPQVAERGAPSPRQMAERSIKAGYLKDARRYLEQAHEDNPLDFAVLLRLGWVCNLLHDDQQAVAWFNLARKSPDPAVAAEAEQSWRNLRPETQTVRVSGWAMPSYSSRWRDTFSYGQVKVEWNLHLPVRPYVSARIIADTRSGIGPINPLYFSESAVIPAVGLATRSWHGALLWGEAGSAIGYLSHRAQSDYRGGLSFARVQGKRWFLDTTADALFMSRFQNDGLLYVQNRAGYSRAAGTVDLQFYWNVNATLDARRQYWANFVEMGPGLRIRPRLPDFPVISIGLLRGVYTVNQDNPRRPNFFDLRIGLWYALAH
jgi:tetratricopeptide (TPR) repeat protein